MFKEKDSDSFAWNLAGLDEQLHLVLSKAVKPVDCQPPSSGIAAPPYSSCRDLLSKIPVWTDRTTFGRAEIPVAQIKLPKIFYSGKSLGVSVRSYCT